MQSRNVHWRSCPACHYSVAHPTRRETDLMAAISRPRRSVLYMPGSNTRALEKARGLVADGLILDLEDAVAPDAKAMARANVAAALRAGGYGRRELVVRVNGLATPWGYDDVAAAAAMKADAVLLPKVESADTVRQAETLLAAAGAPAGLALWCMMETPLGMLHAEEIAATSPRVACLVMGTSDLAKDLHARHTRDRLPMLTALGLCLLAARAAPARAPSDVSADEGFELADEGEVFDRLVRELVAVRAVVLRSAEIEGDQIGLGGGRGLERFDDLVEPRLGILGDRLPVLVLFDVRRQRVSAEEVADLALAQPAPAEKIEMEQSEQRARGELLAKLVILEAGAGDAVEKRGVEIERKFAVLVAHDGAAVADRTHRFAQVADDRSGHQCRVVADIRRITPRGNLARHRLGDLVEAVGEKRLSPHPHVALVVVVARQVGIGQQLVPLPLLHGADELRLALDQRRFQGVPGKAIEFKAEAHRSLPCKVARPKLSEEV